jgi:hypothetical protein
MINKEEKQTFLPSHCNRNLTLGAIARKINKILTIETLD